MLFACSGSSEGTGEDMTLRVAVTAPGLPFLQLYIADEQGFFEDEGLDVSFVNVDGSAASTAAIQSGSADITVTLPEGEIVARSAGTNTKIIGATVKKNLYKMFVSPSVSSLDDLAGQKIAMLTEGNGTDIQARRLLDLEGAGAANSTFVATGALPNRLAALKQGEVAGTLLFPPFDVIAESEGLTPLFSLSEVSVDYPNEVVSTTEKVMEEKPEALRAFMAALVRATAFIEEEFDEAVRIGAEVTSTDADIVRASLQNMLDEDAFAEDGAVAVEGLQGVIASMEDYGNFTDLPPATDLYDDSFLPN
ncbi:ABC transporter substrate-binding protein [Aeromicrobium phragmitis]|uniref:ABC transporter substrate-binding protein n=1 Tax=Aeromicrobium phragmitis TaxID=2478914 RepID=A0A3L8PTM5_9ACTN|nr:ABC transporter substrate-binding protein [Aeromicrobium phragmitis]